MSQLLVAKAQQLQATVKPLVGPSSILLALMASGLNGQQFSFHLKVLTYVLHLEIQNALLYLLLLVQICQVGLLYY